MEGPSRIERRPILARPGDRQGRALLVVIDGLGFNRRTSKAVASSAWAALAASDKAALTRAAQRALASRPELRMTPDGLARLLLYPVHAEALEGDTPWDSAISLLDALAEASQTARASMGRAARAIQVAAIAHRYVPWMANAPRFARLRNAHLTMPTSASGKWAGFEDTDPPARGNSETGHQQIANLSLASQTPREITESITDGSFFTNKALNDAVRKGLAPGKALNFCFLLSGVQGDDGRVHSAWNHLEAFLELVFSRHRADPRQVRMQAVLDGRDCPPRASLEGLGGAGKYLDRLQTLLDRYKAEECLAWVVGRSTAMDRDYREQNTRADYLLLTRGEGARVQGFAGAKQAVQAAHASGVGDSDVPPIAVADRAGQVRVVGPGEAFVNLNFRPDRQRAKTAALASAHDFLEREAGLRGRSYSSGWAGAPLRLNICTIAEYHPDFEQKHGVSVAFPVRPQKNNLLALWPQVMPGQKYFMAVESVKALHMGYFFRGRRANPMQPDIEDREMVSSFAEADGVNSDSDFIKYPQMRNPEVADAVVRAANARAHALICCNLSAPDMIGHLMPEETDKSPQAEAAIAAAVTAYEATGAAIERMAEAALKNGYFVVVTSDHGNVEDAGPAHSANDVLTTVMTPGKKYVPARRDTYQVRLFDVSWTVASLLGAEEAVREVLASGGSDFDSPFSGRPLVGRA
jgi:2,3-bisphosphoglycerate-independent phosphoglycerate mutase